MSKVLSLDSINNPTPEEFRKATNNYKKPILITGAIDKWPALEKWTVDYFEKVYGNEEFNVFKSPKGEKHFTTADRHAGMISMKLKDYLNIIKMPTTSRS